MSEAKNPYIPHDHVQIEGCVACVWDEGKAEGKPDRTALATIILEADNPQHHIDVSEAYVMADAVLAEFYSKENIT